MYVEGEGGHTSPYAMAGRIYFRTEFLSEYVLVKANSWTNGQIFLEIRVATDAQYMAVFDMVSISLSSACTQQLHSEHAVDPSCTSSN